MHSYLVTCYHKDMQIEGMRITISPITIPACDHVYRLLINVANIGPR